MFGFPKRRFIALTVALLLVTGCSSLRDSYDQIMGTTYRPKACPRVSILADAANLTRFATGPGRDLTDVRFESTISGVDVKCAYDLEEDTSGKLEVDVSLFFDTTQGPANRENQATLPYFLAVLDSQRQVLERKTFDFTVGFAQNAVQISLKDQPVHFVLPLKVKEIGTDFEIYAGFALTEEEAEFNRRRKAR